MIIVCYIFFLSNLIESCFAEEPQFEVYKCKSYHKKVPSEAIIEELKNMAPIAEVIFYEIGKKVGSYKADLVDIYNGAINYDQSMDPFFGRSDKYILKYSNKFYIILFENDKRNKLMQGKRCGIGILTDVYSNKIFVGNPYQGVIFQKDILACFKSLGGVDKLRMNDKSNQ